MARVELIAEISTNHGGSLELAKTFIHRFAEAGADWIKFQHTRVKHLRRDDPQYDWFAQAELSVEQFQTLKAYCALCGVRFLTTIYNEHDIAEVQALGLEAIKIGSGEAGEALVTEVRRAGFPRIFVSDGLVDPRVWDGYEVFRCVTRYPAPHGCVPAAFDDRKPGWSDHCVGLESCQVAIVRGARIIEKHVQLPNQARAHKPWEATVDEFKALRAFADEDPTRFLGRWQAA